MSPEDDPRLKALLNEWQPQVDLPPRFESEVWKRIALAQEKSANRFSWEWLWGITCPPRVAFALVLTAVFFGMVSADLRAQETYHHEMAAAESRYVRSVDPFARHDSNP
jgi:hypothetical protein